MYTSVLGCGIIDNVRGRLSIEPSLNLFDSCLEVHTPPELLMLIYPNYSRVRLYPTDLSVTKSDNLIQSVAYM